VPALRALPPVSSNIAAGGNEGVMQQMAGSAARHRH
jgi:hypothetical protein